MNHGVKKRKQGLLTDQNAQGSFWKEIGCELEEKALSG
jgi:hypothetical protein